MRERILEKFLNMPYSFSKIITSDCSRLVAAGALHSRGRAWPAPTTARARRRPQAWGTESGGRGGRRRDVGELEGGAGPLGGADGGHHGGRAYEAAAGPAEAS